MKRESELLEKIFESMVTAPSPVKTPTKPSTPSKPDTKPNPNPFAPRPGRTPRENPTPRPKGAVKNISDSLRKIFQKYISHVSH